MDENSNSSKYAIRYTPDEFETKIIPLLKKNSKGLSISQIAHSLNINRNTVSKYLKTLEARNIIVPRKTGVTTLWYHFEKNSRNYSGPYILVIELKGEEGNIEVNQTNSTYANRIHEIPESLIGASIWNFSPFKEFQDPLTEYFEEGFAHIYSTGELYSRTLNLKTQEGKPASYLFKLDTFKENNKQFTLEFHDLTLQREIEFKLLNTNSFDQILDLFDDFYLSIQTEDFKVIKASKKVLDDFNNGKELTSEILHCYELYQNKNKVCENCPALKSLQTDKKVSTTFMINDKEHTYNTIPISAVDDDIRGYILKISVN